MRSGNTLEEYVLAEEKKKWSEIFKKLGGSYINFHTKERKMYEIFVATET